MMTRAERDEHFAACVERWRASPEPQREMTRRAQHRGGLRVEHTPDPDDLIDLEDGDGPRPIRVVDNLEVIAPGGYTVEELDSGRLAEWDDE